MHEVEDSFHRQLDVARRHRAVFTEGTPADYPSLRMPPGTRVIDERGAAGTVNPRVLVGNQLRAAQAAGARLVRDHVVGIEAASGGGHRVRLAGGGEVVAERVVVAAGAYVDRFDLLPSPIPVHGVGITAMFFRVDTAAAEALAAMPCLLWHAGRDDAWFYSVPPTRYPDGNLWFKIGGHLEHAEFSSRADVDDWFRSGGNEREVAYLTDWVAEHIPALAGCGEHSIACAITETATGFPIIDEVASGVVVASGCSGASAKSCDEIGRLGAVLSAHGRWDSPLDRRLFSGQPEVSA